MTLISSQVQSTQVATVSVCQSPFCRDSSSVEEQLNTTDYYESSVWMSVVEIEVCIRSIEVLRPRVWKIYPAYSASDLINWLICSKTLHKPQ